MARSTQHPQTQNFPKNTQEKHEKPVKTGSLWLQILTQDFTFMNSHQI
jgi:hypothetical protein